MLKLTINLKPKAKQSVQQGVTFQGRRSFYKKAGVEDFENKVRWIVKAQLPKDFELIRKGPLEVSVEYRTKMKGIKKDRYKTTRPDVDSNLNKALFDALTGIIWIDDAIVSKITAVKYCSYEDRIDITINKLEE